MQGSFVTLEYVSFFSEIEQAEILSFWIWATLPILSVEKMTEDLLRIDSQIMHALRGVVTGFR